MFIFSLLLLVLGSCSKENEIKQPLSIQPIQRVDSAIPNNQPTVKNSRHATLKDVFQGLEKEKLSQFVGKVKGSSKLRTSGGHQIIPNDPLLEQEAAQMLQPLNASILSYLSFKYPQFGPTDMIDINDPDFTYFATVYQVAEHVNFVVADIPLITLEKGTNGVAAKMPTWLRCTVNVAMGYFDITSVIKGLGTFNYSSVWTAVKFAAKRYLGCIAAAILIYDIATECF